MFAVPGWNLSVPLKAETPVRKAGGSNNSKKRKRKEGKQQIAQVSGENVGDMWAQVMEGVPVAAAVPEKGVSGDKKKGEGKHKNKKQRQESDGGAVAAKAEGKAEERKVEEAQDAKRGEGNKKGNKKGNKNEKKQKDKQHDKKHRQQDAEQAAAETTAPAIPAVPPALPPANTKLTPLQAKMREKLVGARFRHLNQTLYTTPSQHSLKLIDEDPQIFNEYHAGFRQQVAGWPENPVDTFVSLVQTRGAVRENWRDKILKRKEKEHTSGRYRKPGEVPPEEAEDSDEEERKRAAAAAAHQLKPLLRTRGTSIIADLGCGDAALATKLQPHLQSLNLRVHSFDLAAPSPLITKADIANLPLPDSSIDVAVFCLALMGTNWLDFIDEAWRVLHWKGELWVAEIKSRFGRVSNTREKKVVDHSVGKRQKKKAEAARKKSGADKKDKEVAAQEEEEELAIEVDGVASGRQETDVSAFVEVLRKRGFVLDAPDPSRERDAVDLRNKMFVRMSFVKAAAPVKGKNVKANEEIYAENAARLAAESGKTFRKKEPKAKFIETEDDGIDESAVLKPCLYKQR